MVDTLQNEALVAVAATGARLAQKAAIINDLLGYACPSQQVQVPGSMEARQGGVSSICMLGLLCVECYSREYGRYGGGVTMVASSTPRVLALWLLQSSTAFAEGA